ncbi:leucine zipper domain-containing protein [Williamsia sp. D3]|uniref:leucine zipper domain-containing protein n=1 Tax=Williamsia sp. D3 TaxID=1313067 RepID=UPI001268763B
MAAPPSVQPATVVRLSASLRALGPSLAVKRSVAQPSRPAQIAKAAGISQTQPGTWRARSRPDGTCTLVDDSVIPGVMKYQPRTATNPKPRPMTAARNHVVRHRRSTAGVDRTVPILLPSHTAAPRRRRSSRCSHFRRLASPSDSCLFLRLQSEGVTGVGGNRRGPGFGGRLLASSSDSCLFLRLQSEDVTEVGGNRREPRLSTGPLASAQATTDPSACSIRSSVRRASPVRSR